MLCGATEFIGKFISVLTVLLVVCKSFISISRSDNRNCKYNSNNT